MSTLLLKVEPNCSQLQIIKVLLKVGTLLIVTGSIIIVSLFLFYSIMPKVIDVHEIFKNPAKFNGNIGVVGEVFLRDNKFFSFMLLDCSEDSPTCSAIPIVYQDKKPEAKSVIIAYGKISKENGSSLFFDKFMSHKINLKNDDSTGKFFYSSRKAIRGWGSSIRTWLYAKCKKCYELKKKLIPTTLFF